MERLAEMSRKPPYRIPSMEEIREIPYSGLTAVSTFSGAGGSSLGYRMAGFRVLWASEFVEAARDVYRANFPDTPVDERDIRSVTGEEILGAAGLEPGELDLLDGSPPCSSFSSAGKREKKWGEVCDYSDTKQRTDDLFFEFARILGELRPKTLVAENVSGLVTGKAQGVFLEIFRALEEAGYVVRAKVLDAKYLGVPQSRRRLIFIGVRKDLGVRPVFPKPLRHTYSLRETVLDADVPKAAADETVWIDRYAIGDEWDRIRPGQKSERYFSLLKADPERPCPAITVAQGSLGAAGVVHPFEKRRFTIPELRRICSFPDDFILTGTYAQKWERLGRAVPPLMMRQIAESVRKVLLPEEAMA